LETSKFVVLVEAHLKRLKELEAIGMPEQGAAQGMTLLKMAALCFDMFEERDFVIVAADAWRQTQGERTRLKGGP
jgi:hypothetical protein